MNIFYLDTDPILAARAHCDRHVNKMAMEGAQMLSTACFKLLDWSVMEPIEHLLYKPTHINHPCNVWVRESYANFIWLYDLVSALDTQHIYRYKTATDHGVVALLARETMFTHGSDQYRFRAFTPPVQAMPDEFKNPNDPVAAYRRYYSIAKRPIARWDKGIPAPSWWEETIITQ